MLSHEHSSRAIALVAVLLGTGLATNAAGAGKCVDALQTTESDGIGAAIATAGHRLALESQHPPGKSDCDHYVVINSDGVKGETGYTIQAGQKIVQVEGVLDGYTVTGGTRDAVQRNIAVGHVGGGTDGYVVWGPVREIKLSNPEAAQVFVDGVRRRARPYNDHVVIIDSRNVPGETGYVLESTGRVEQVEGELHGWQASIDPGDTVRGGQASGHVSTGVDAFRVYGPIEAIRLDNADAARVYIDGEERLLQAAELGSSLGEALSSGLPSQDSGSEAGNETVVGSGAVVGIGSGVAEASDTSPSAFAGTWSTTFDELRLHRVGRFLIGDYADSGIILARVRDQCAAGIFTNGGRNGRFRFELTEADRFEGEWNWHGEPLSKSWRGKRTGPPPERLRNFARGTGSTRTLDNDRDVYDGRYDSNHGELSILSRDLFLIGKYADRGILAGMWDGTSFVGRFTNNDRTGWFDFAFYSKNGTFREGQWGWLEESGGGQWRLERVGTNSRPEPADIAPDIACS